MTKSNPGVDMASATAPSEAAQHQMLAHQNSSLGSLPEKLEEQCMNDEYYTLIAKYGKEKITLVDLSPDTTIAQVKQMLQAHTRILPIRQKLVGLLAEQGGAKGVHDELPIDRLKVKGGAKAKLKNCHGKKVIQHQFILMGTPEEQIFIDPSERDDLPDVLDDFDLDFNAGSDQWLQHKANEDNLRKFSEVTEFHIMNPPRPGKPLLVLDLDHTLLDFSSKTLQQDTATVVGEGLAAVMKRPFMDEFLTQCYQHYDLVIWSQTSWRWLETKLIELGMVTHPGYKVRDQITLNCCLIQ
jgi:ubiquitin-like domain-containing CTD phosphatase 1